MSLSRVIEVSFNGGSIAYAKVDTAYFYNNGIIFKPTDIDLPASYQVHWADSPQASSTLETIGTAEGAPIPDDLWNRSRVIYGWIYLHPTEDSGITAYEVRIYKNVRAGLPDGTEPTPAEQSTIDQLISALNSAVEQTGEDVESASQSAQSAESAKTAAESARDTAGEYANDAESSAASASTSASQASTSATASAESAEQAAQIKMDVEALADDAQGYAETASQSASASAQSASASANSATTAQGYANSASASAQSASGYASSAQTSAQTASAKAQDASTSAQTASQKATESAQSATNASQSAQTAEQAKTASQTAQGLAESARDSAVQAKTDAESARDDAVQAKEDAESAVASISDALDDKAPVITDTASGAVASFSDGADDIPLKSLVVDINPVQDLHGYDSPWPAGGGKNLIYKTLKRVNISSDCKITAYNAYDVFCAKVESGKTYTISINGVAARSVDVGYFAEDPVLGSTTYDGNRILNLQATFEATYTGFIGFRFDADTANVQLEEGSTPTAWTPYENICPISGWTQINVNHSDADTTNPTTITIDLGQTVYGGKLDVLSGELTVYPYYASYNGETLTGEWISDRDKYVSGTTPTIGAQVVNIGAQGVTVQLEPHEVESLYGVNNIWADSGDTEVEYRADTKAYIAKKIAEALASLT